MLVIFLYLIIQFLLLGFVVNTSKHTTPVANAASYITVVSDVARTATKQEVLAAIISLFRFSA